eukprot:9385552-Alexandrium_andersonii.AAC.1
MCSRAHTRARVPIHLAARAPKWCSAIPDPLREIWSHLFTSSRVLGALRASVAPNAWPDVDEYSDERGSFEYFLTMSERGRLRRFAELKPDHCWDLG